MLTPETLTADTTRRHHCPICQGAMEPGAWFCSQFCSAVAELRRELDEMTISATSLRGEGRARATGYIAGLRRALNLLTEMAPAGNPLAVAGTQPGDVLYRRAFTAHEYLLVRAARAPKGPGVGGARLEAWQVRQGQLQYTGTVSVDALEIHEWHAIGTFENATSFVADGEVGHA